MLPRPADKSRRRPFRYRTQERLVSVIRSAVDCCGDSSGKDMSAVKLNELGDRDSEDIKRVRRKGLPWLIAAFGAVIIVLIILLIVVMAQQPADHHSSSPGETVISYLSAEEPQPPKAVNRSFPRKSIASTFRKVAVLSDNALCSEIARSILMRGGNAIDATIAVTFCLGAVNGHLSGIGGGFIMTRYNRKFKLCSTIDATSPLPGAFNLPVAGNDSKTGYKSIGIPGEVHGLWIAFKKYSSGRVAWQDLITPSVNLLLTGFPVSKSLESVLEKNREQILDEPSMSSFYVNSATGNLFREGEFMKNPHLAETLRRLAITPSPDRYFYHDKFGERLAGEILANGGLVTAQDLANFSSSTNEFFKAAKLSNKLSLCGSVPPSGFALTYFMAAVLAALYPTSSATTAPVTDDPLFWQRFAHVQNIAQQHLSHLGDIRFYSNVTAERLLSPAYINDVVTQIKATSNWRSNSVFNSRQESPLIGVNHVYIVDANGDAVALSSTLGSPLGSLRRSPELGILFNNQASQFTSDPGNQPAPGKRPLMTAAPIIGFRPETGDVAFVTGGGQDPGLAQVLFSIASEDLSEEEKLGYVIDFPRLNSNVENVESFLNPSRNASALNGQSSPVHVIVRNADGSLTGAIDAGRLNVHTYPAGF